MEARQGNSTGRARGEFLLEEPAPANEVRQANPSPFARLDYGHAGEKRFALSACARWPLGETQSPLTGYAGLTSLMIVAASATIAAASGQALLSRLDEWTPVAALVLACVSMIAVELLCFKTYRRNFNFASPRPVDTDAWERIRERLMALCACLWWSALICALWSLISPVYLPCLALALPAILALSLPYFWLVERYAAADSAVDEMLVLGRCLKESLARACGRTPRPGGLTLTGNSYAHNLLRGIFVKSFFAPYMTLCCFTWWHIWTVDSVTAIETTGSLLVAPFTVLPTFNAWDKAVIAFIFAADSTVALLGYVMSCRLLDTQFSSVDPSPTGWFWTLVCYNPLNALLEVYIWSQIITLPMTWPAELLAQQPLLGVAVSLGLLSFSAVFVWTTASYGLRFSNMSNRGIISSGPYALVRHPHYVCKNGIWALSLVPLLVVNPAGCIGPALGVIGATCVYILRALTEESHLLRDPHYQEYCRRVRWRFIPGLI